MRRVSCQECRVRHLTCIADLPIDDIPRFQTFALPGVYKPRQVVFHEGHPADGLYVVCQGTVKLYQSDRFGRDFILDIATPGTLLGELGLNASATYSASAEAVTDAQLSFLPRERLARFIEAHPQIGVRLVATLGEALARARRKAGELALKHADARLADLLLRLADGAVGPGPTRIELGYSRRELAEMIGVSTETVIRLIGKLKRGRLIATDGGDIVILHAERLTRLAQHAALDGGRASGDRHAGRERAQDDRRHVTP
jgi:CRP/FNR family transcriptional regulator